MSDNLTAETLQEIANFADTLLTKFSQPEFIAGCQVMGTADMNQYAAGNGWVEALCGQHNQQRVRWKSGEAIGTTNYIDVIHFPAYHLFEAWGVAGTAAISGGIAASIADAKGDLIAATAADTVSRLAVGANYTSLLADSSQTTGLLWRDGVTPLVVKNTSGSTVAAYAVGAIIYTAGSGLEFSLTTTTGQLCAVVVGGANNADIKAVTRGRFALSYSGTAPSAGDFLVPWTGTGTVLQQTYMSPDVCAIAMANGSGGTVEALLLCNRVPITLSSTVDIFRVNGSSGSNFTGTINGAPSGATVVYTITGGTNENSIKPAAANELAKIVLHNTTRGTSALIDDVDVGTNTITLTANAPAAWASGDVITTRSQTNTDSVLSMYFYDYDLSSADNAVIPVLATSIQFGTAMVDAGSTQMFVHPFETGSASKRLATSSSAPTSNIDRTIALINRKFCVLHGASGSATATILGRIVAATVAAP